MYSATKAARRRNLVEVRKEDLDDMEGRICKSGDEPLCGNRGGLSSDGWKGTKQRGYSLDAIDLLSEHLGRR